MVDSTIRSEWWNLSGIAINFLGKIALDLKYIFRDVRVRLLVLFLSRRGSSYRLISFFRFILPCRQSPLGEGLN